MRNFLLLITVILPCVSHATQQIADILEFDGKEYQIEQTPLSSIMSEKTIAELIEPQTVCSASWRGYQAKWKIESKVLYFVEIRKDPCEGFGKKVTISVLFPESDSPVMASWFSGRITAATGKWWGDEKEIEDGTTIMDNYKYEIEVFEISNGILIDKRTEMVGII